MRRRARRTWRTTTNTEAPCCAHFDARIEEDHTGLMLLVLWDVHMMSCSVR